MIQRMPPDAERRVLFRIRPARPHDAAEITRLSAQLSYPNAEEAIRGRLARIEESPTSQVFVATLPDETVVGWIQVVQLEILVSDTGAAITGLVVDGEHRRSGVGKHLVGRAEDWAKGLGCRTLIVRSRDHRKGAHEFYERLGYATHKRQIAFRKRL